MKRTLITSLLASALLFGGGCSDDFDDSALWKGVDEIYNQLTELEKQADQLNDQIRLLSSIVNGGAITSITQDAEGNDVIRFKGADNIEHSVTVATKDDVSSAPILGTKEENGVLYWTTTVDGNTDFLKDTDGSKIPVAGRTPEMAVDKEGYWTLNGRRLTDASGNPVKAEGKACCSEICNCSAENSATGVLAKLSNSARSICVGVPVSVSRTNNVPSGPSVSRLPERTT